MRCFYPTLISALLSASAAFAGPHHVRSEESFEPALQAGQRLQLPEKMPVKPEIAPPAPPMIEPSIGAGQIRISDSSSLLASYGVLLPEKAGFSHQVWQYMSYPEALKAVSGLRAPSAVALLNERLVSLLTLRADAPRDAQAGWFITRIHALKALDAQADAQAMTDAVPEALWDEVPLAQLLEFSFESREPERACDTFSVRPESQVAALEASLRQRLELFCSAQSGDFAAVELAMALAEERGEGLPSWFVKLLESMQYEHVSAPDASAAQGELERAMVASLTPAPEAAKAKAEKPYPNNPSYALLAITRHIRAQELAQTDAWLAMLDRSQGASAASFAAHELVRFLKSDPAQARSGAANSLPPFTGVADASEADKQLLARFYGVMGAFGFDLPVVTMEWLAQQEALGGANPSAIGLEQAAQAGDKAGYLLQLPSWIDSNLMAELSNEAIIKRIEELVLLREAPLARQLAAEAVLLKLQ